MRPILGLVWVSEWDWNVPNFSYFRCCEGLFWEEAQWRDPAPCISHTRDNGQNSGAASRVHAPETKVFEWGDDPKEWGGAQLWHWSWYVSCVSSVPRDPCRSTGGKGGGVGLMNLCGICTLPTAKKMEMGKWLELCKVKGRGNLGNELLITVFLRNNFQELVCLT